MYLNCKTYYSFRYGTFSTQQLVNTAVEMGAASLALTNINSTCDAWDFVKQCGDVGIKPILGVEIRNMNTIEYILIAANNKGFAWINRFLSRHLEAKQAFPSCAEESPFFDDEWDGFVIYPMGKKPATQLFANERIGVLPWEINKLWGMDEQTLGNRYVIRQPVTFQNKKYFNLHKLLRAIDHNILGSLLRPENIASERETFETPGSLLEKYAAHPSLITATFTLMDACSISMDFNSDKNKKFYTASKQDDEKLLKKLATDGLKKRYGVKNRQAPERLAKELKIISDLGFNAYFLINWDMIRYAQSRGFYYVGRGSGANSIVAYCLGITKVDPIELNLYFERFLNPHRTSPPDFDIDFSHSDRNDVIDYVFKRYGKEHVCLLGSFSTFKLDSSIRELGKVFGLPKDEIDALQKRLIPEDDVEKMILQYASIMNGFPNYNSIHACGILVTEEPVRSYLATFQPPKDFATAQIDMYGAESIGINKFDVLSQRGLSHIRTTQDIISEQHGIDIDINDFEKFRKDGKVNEQIRSANTIGCFYIESPAMRQLLKKLRCNDYSTLVAASSIIRPGVAQSGMMRAYIERYHNPSKTQYLHSMFKEHLSETFGVMVFQEDVIKIAHYFAGLDLGEADILRRAMSLTKYKANNSFDIVREKFFKNCETLGHPAALATEVWRQMESFAGYSFNKAHSASYAVESYMSLYLKTHYPIEFMVGVINNFGGFYPTSLYFFELLKAGATLVAPCINISDEYTKIHEGKVYVGFVHVKDLQQRWKEKIMEERKAFGPFLHLQDFIERTKITREQLNILISSGCFAFSGKGKKRLLNEANLMQPNNKNHIPARLSLFEDKPVSFALPDLTDYPLDDLYDQVENLGFPLQNPFEMADADPAEYVYAKDLDQYLHQRITVLIYFIAYKIVPTVKGTSMSFGTFIDPELNWIDTVHFPESFKKYPITKNGFYRATGKVVADFGVCSLEVHHMEEVHRKMPTYAGL